jgi:hypothetical protein
MTAMPVEQGIIITEGRVVVAGEKTQIRDGDLWFNATEAQALIVQIQAILKDLPSPGHLPDVGPKQDQLASLLKGNR